MKTALAFFLTCSLVTLIAWSNPTITAMQDQDEPAAKAVDDHEALEKEMKLLKSATRRLKKKFRKEEVEAKDLLADIRICGKALLTAKGLFPKALEGEKMAKSRAEYSSIIIDCLIENLKAEKALLANDTKTAATAFKNMLGAQKKGHEKFKE